MGIFDRMDTRTVGIWSMVAAVLAVAYLLYPKPQQEMKQEGVEEIVFWAPMDKYVFDPLKPVIEEFEKRNPGYKVRLGSATARERPESGGGGGPTRFLLGVAGGQPPDLIFFDRFAIVE